MYLKRKYISLLYVLIIALAVGFSSSMEEIVYDFPLERDVVEQVILEKQLTWRIEDEQSLNEGQSNFSLRDEDNVFCSINSTGGEWGRVIVLQFHFPLDYTTEQIQQFNKEEWPNIFELTCTFYGNSKDAKKIYKEFLGYLQDRNSNEYDYGYFTKRIDDTHFRVKLAPFTNNSNYYQIATLEILNSETYEKRAFEIFAKGWINRAKRQGIKVLDNISVSDITEIKTEDEELRLIVKGHLEDIQELKNIPKNLQEALTHHAHKDDYFTAKLVDDTGSMDVFVLATSLNSRELGQDRSHHINYYTKGKLSVINFSPLNE